MRTALLATVVLVLGSIAIVPQAPPPTTDWALPKR
jgi:hypothetical protein